MFYQFINRTGIRIFIKVYLYIDGLCFFPLRMQFVFRITVGILRCKLQFVITSRNVVVTSACEALFLRSSLSSEIWTWFIIFLLQFTHKVFYIHVCLKILSEKCLKIFNFENFIGWFLYFMATNFADFIVANQALQNS